MKKYFRLTPLIAFAQFLPDSAYAHPGTGATAGLSEGLAHPFSGLDHMLVMLAVGIWAFRIGGRAVWAIPFAFIGMMIVGALLGSSGWTIPYVEQGILLSLLVAGILIAGSVRMPLLIGMAIAGIFAIFHGHAHGAEIPLFASGLLYGGGFVIATALLHSLGIVSGLIFARFPGRYLDRYAGFGIAAAGVILCIR